jgi:hypothetical protein
LPGQNRGNLNCKHASAQHSPSATQSLIHLRSHTLFLVEIFVTSLQRSDNMLGVLRRPCNGTAWHHYHRPQLTQPWMCQMSFARWRSTPTKPAPWRTEHEPDHEPCSSIPVIRPKFLYSKAGRARIAQVDETDTRKQERLWAELKRAETQLPKTNDIPQRKRALERMYADLVVLNARSQVHSSDHMRELCETSNSIAFRRWQRERRRRDTTWLLARARSARLWIFAPMQDVSVFSRISRLLRFVGLLPYFLIAGFVTCTGPISRWHDRWHAKLHAWSQEKDKKGK